MATRTSVCRLCRENVSVKKMTSLFTRISLERKWGSRITALLGISVSKDDQLPPHVCPKCISRIVTLERALVDLEDFKRSVNRPFKRTKETTGEVGVSPNTLRVRPHSKIARRLNFTSKYTLPYYTN